MTIELIPSIRCNICDELLRLADPNRTVNRSFYTFTNGPASEIHVCWGCIKMDPNPNDGHFYYSMQKFMGALGYSFTYTSQ